MNANLDAKWSWYQERLKEAEEMLDNSKDSFKLGLLEESEKLNEAAAQLLSEYKYLPTSQNT